MTEMKKKKNQRTKINRTQKVSVGLKSDHYSNGDKEKDLNN